MGMGVDTFSMSPALLAQVKLAIRCFNQARARVLADTALGMDDGFSIHRLMNGVLEEIRSSPETAGV
jgi:phosphoenolpyruvate-protein kinase (PTS system EI component)